MPYVSYGVAISEVSAGVREANSVPAPLRETDVNAGAVYGIGIDMSIGRGWRARLDHTVTDLGDVTYHIPSQNSAGFVDGAVHETSLALLYRFGAADGAHGTGSRASEGWAGPYAGLSLGWQNGDSRQDNSLPATTGNYDLDGEAIGLFAGYNWQIDRAVIGAEFGLSASNLSGETTTLCPIVCFTDISQAASIRANAGIDLGRWMPYATAGVRVLTTDVGTRSGGFGAEDINLGAFAGAGVAYSLTDAVFLRGEVLHGDGGETTYFITGGEVGTVPTERLTEVSVGIGIRF